MTISEAKIIIDSFRKNNGHYTEDEFFLYTEAAGLIIHETNDPEYMLELGVSYYEQKNYDLALKYYEMASNLGYDTATIGLGYIWYYGRTGKVDYEKAFHYFSMAANDPIAQYKLADMYHNGYYVEKDENKYKEIIEKLYKIYAETNYVEDPLPELCTRLAGIREKEGDIQEAIRLLREGKSMLSSRIGYNPFFGNYSIMRGLIHDLYRLTPLDKNNFDLFDLYELMKEPVKVRFTYNGIPHIIESSREPDDSIAVCYEGKWFRNIGEMLMNAEIEGHLLTLSAWKCKNFEIV